MGDPPLESNDGFRIGTDLRGNRPKGRANLARDLEEQIFLFGVASARFRFHWLLLCERLLNRDSIFLQTPKQKQDQKNNHNQSESATRVVAP
jgi:hypothetical protein